MGILGVRQPGVEGTLEEHHPGVEGTLEEHHPGVGDSPEAHQPAEVVDSLGLEVLLGIVDMLEVLLVDSPPEVGIHPAVVAACLKPVRI